MYKNQISQNDDNDTDQFHFVFNFDQGYYRHFRKILLFY